METSQHSGTEQHRTSDSNACQQPLLHAKNLLYIVKIGGFAAIISIITALKLHNVRCALQRQKSEMTKQRVNKNLEQRPRNYASVG